MAKIAPPSTLRFAGAQQPSAKLRARQTCPTDVGQAGQPDRLNFSESIRNQSVRRAKHTAGRLAAIIKNVSMKGNYNMKKFLIGIFILLTFLNININAQEIFGDWIKTKVTYADNVELLNNNAIKYQYLKYTFEKHNKLFMSFVFDSKGSGFFFEIDSNILQIKNSYGYFVNSFQIIKVSNDELILIQKGETGFTDEDCLKFYFVKEKTYQNNLSIKPSDILSINKNDTVYKESEKVYAKFSGDKPFFDFCHEFLPEVNAQAIFLATFIIRKNGTIDSIQVLESINKRFEKQFRKALDKSKSLWLPGELGDRKVDVQMKIEFKYSTSAQMIPMMEYSKKGKESLNNLDYSKALTYFDLALEKMPTDYEILYYKAICEMNLGNNKAACEDFQKVKLSEKMNVDELIEQNCK